MNISDYVSICDEADIIDGRMRWFVWRIQYALRGIDVGRVTIEAALNNRRKQIE